ncbi:uncharacterized protein LOC144729185 [Lampetra planeri]
MEKKNEIQERYMKFPNLFQLEYNKQLEKQVMTKLERKKSCSATAEEFESDVCNLNCLAFLHLKRQTLNRAKPIVAEVLAKDPQNITALANQCELLLLSYDFKKAAEVLGELEAQRDNEGANAMALAEQGYFLSRMGPRVYLQAIEKFEQAIEKGRGHCSQDKIIFWHYNIALNYDRISKMEFVRENPGFSTEEYFKKVVQTLAHVMCSKHKIYEPKAWIVLAQTAKEYFRIMKYHIDYDETKIFELTGFKLMTMSDCFNQASQLAPDDPWVLGRVGRHCRHIKQNKSALELLQKSHDLCPSEFALHHLGLTYRTLAAEANRQSLQEKPLFRKNKTINEGPNIDVASSVILEDNSKFILRVICPVTCTKRSSPTKSRAPTWKSSKRETYAGAYGNCTDPKVNEYVSKAIDCFEKAIQLSEDTAHKLRVDLAGMYSARGMHTEADECYINALQDDRKVTHYSRAFTLEKWGLAQHECGDQTKSQHLLRMAIEEAAKVNTTRKVAFERLIQELVKCNDTMKQSDLHQLVGKHREALTLLREAYKHNSNDPKILCRLIKSLAAEKDYDTAHMYLAILKRTNEGHDKISRDLQVEICFGAAEMNMRMLSVDSKTVLGDLYEELMENQEKQQSILMLHTIDSDEDSTLAEHFQQLAEDIGGVKCELFSEKPAGTFLVNTILEAVDEHNAIVLLITPEFVRHQPTLNLCIYLLQKPCVLLCLCTSISKDQIPPKFQDIHQAPFPERLRCKGITENTVSIEELHMWREIFDHLRVAKDKAGVK